MTEFYKTATSHPAPLPAASINLDGAPDPVPYDGSSKSHFKLPATGDGLRLAAHMHAGKALVELDRMVLCIEALGLKRPLKTLTTMVTTLDSLRDSITTKE